MTMTAFPLSNPNGTERKILVAIDFGTTFSGAAWAQTARPEVQSIIVQWPDGSHGFEGVTDDKVPTELCYDGVNCKWGFQIPEGHQRYQWFKLGLDPHKTEETSCLAVEYPDPNALPMGNIKRPEKLSIDYLTKIREHVVKVLKTKLGEGVVASTTIEYVITVPAIWSDSAKYRTRACATRAGMGTDLQIISEPEAAVIYTLDTMDPGTLQVGDTFVLCDAGGGTVDLISYMVEELEPAVRVSEVAPGNGATCGSTFLNRIFRKFLEDNFAENDGWDEDTLDAALERFETIAKRKFDGEQDDITIPVPGLSNDPTKGVLRGKLTLSASTLRDIFRPVITRITALVSAQITGTDEEVKAVLLVGGFGQNPFLRESIQRVVGPDIQVVQPPKGWTAVVQGALIKGLAEACPAASRISIGSRVARKAYGCCIGTTFVEGKHEKGRRYWADYEGKYCVDVVDWLLRKGDAIKETKPITVYYCNTKLASNGQLSSIAVRLHVFDSPTSGWDPPMYPDQGAKLLVTLRADLSSIPTSQMPQRRGDDGQLHFVCGFEIRVTFHSAHTTYSLWYKDKCYGAVDAEYA